MHAGPETGCATASLEELAYYNIFLVEPIFELVAEG
jgi:hypothetical protein